MYIWVLPLLISGCQRLKSGFEQRPSGTIGDKELDIGPVLRTGPQCDFPAKIGVFFHCFIYGIISSRCIDAFSLQRVRATVLVFRMGTLQRDRRKARSWHQRDPRNSCDSIQTTTCCSPLKGTEERRLFSSNPLEVQCSQHLRKTHLCTAQAGFLSSLRRPLTASHITIWRSSKTPL